MKLRVTFLILALPFIATGCASVFNTASESTFSCPGMPQGVVCKTPMAVYKSTNQMPSMTESDLPIGQSMKDFENGRKNAVVETGFKLPEKSEAVAAQAIDAGSKPGYVRPVREPATVMRIWIAPWIDKNDDLHMPSYVFTEIQPRRWAVGKSELAGKGAVIPFKNLASSAPVQPVEKPADSKSQEGVDRQPAQFAVPGIPAPSDIKLD